MDRQWDNNIPVLMYNTLFCADGWAQTAGLLHSGGAVAFCIAEVYKGNAGEAAC